MGGFPFSVFLSASLRGKRSRRISDQAKERQMDGTFNVSLRKKWGDSKTRDIENHVLEFDDSKTRDIENHVLEFGLEETDHHKDTPL